MSRVVSRSCKHIAAQRTELCDIARGIIRSTVLGLGRLGPFDCRAGASFHPEFGPELHTVVRDQKRVGARDLQGGSLPPFRQRCCAVLCADAGVHRGVPAGWAVFLPRLVRVLQPRICVVAYVTGHVDQDRVGR